jgi:hypothetical protein
LRKDKIVLEQEVLLLRTKQQRQMLPDPRQLNLLPNPNDV